MTEENEFDDLAQDLHAMRAEPRPDYTRELDQRAAEWLRERPRRRLPSLRIAIPAVAGAAAAAVIVALAVSGGGDDGGGGSGGELEVAVVAEGTPQSGLAAPEQAAPGGALEAPFERDESEATGGVFLLPTTEGETLTVQYLFPALTKAKVELAGREAEVELEKGSGTLEISTEGLPRGTQDLTITAPPAPTYRERVQIGG